MRLRLFKPEGETTVMAELQGTFEKMKFPSSFYSSTGRRRPSRTLPPERCKLSTLSAIAHQGQRRREMDWRSAGGQLDSGPRANPVNLLADSPAK